ncbi:AAA family ATPase [Micromonospora sp. NPDC048999]|uniref:helix-turn-helix transcriptional regulator n=1 Tax=Micromonospora sp. NPDC048999 TaxID=3155391 RepID=UPI0033FDDC43
MVHMGESAQTAPLIGRQRHLDLLQRRLRQLHRGRPRIVEVVGGPGAGKSRLLGALTVRAAHEGLPVLTVTPTELPHGAAAELLQALAAHAGAEGGQPASTEPALARLLPAEVNDRHDVRRSSYAVANAVRVMLDRAGGDGLVLVCDDAHRLDPSSIDVLAHLLHHPPATPVLLVLAHRSRQAPVELRDILAGAGAACLTVEPLADADVDRLAGSSLCGPHRRDLPGASGGVPMTALALAAWCDGALCTGRPFTAPVDGPPPPAARALQAELARLGPHAERTLSAAAVAGEPFDPVLVGAVAELDGDAVLAAIDELLAADVVRCADNSGQFRFRDPAVRRVAYAGAPGGWRLGAHARALQTLQQRGAPTHRCAEHLARVALPGDVAAADDLATGARALQGTDPDTAVALYRCALRLLPDEPAAVVRRGELLLATAHCCVTTGRAVAATAALDAWLALPWVDRDPDASARAVELRATVLRASDEHDAADALLREAIEAQPDSRDARPLARLRLALAASPAATPQGADDALLTATGTGVPVLLAHALALSAHARAAAGAVGAAQRVLDEAARLVDQLPDQALGGRLAVVADLGVAELAVERTGESLRHLRRGARLAAAGRHWQLLVPMQVAIGWVHLVRGDHADAARCVAEAATLTATLEAPALTTAVEALRGVLGKADEAGTVVPGWRGGYLPGRLAAALLAAGGDPDAVLAVGGGPELPGLPAYARVGVLDLLARLAAPSDAVDRARRAHEVATQLRLPGQLALAQLTRADTEPDRRQAQQAARSAAAGARECDLRALVAWAAVAEVRAVAAERGPDAMVGGGTSGPAEGARGSADGGRPGEDVAGVDLAAAIEMATRAVREGGGPRLEAELAVVLATLRARPDRVGPTRPVGGVARLADSLEADKLSGLTALTPREHQVAEHVSLGCTNRQIARRLAVSHKTVETHLGRIFNKLGVQSRAEIANLIGRATGPAAYAPDGAETTCPLCGTLGHLASAF